PVSGQPVGAAKTFDAHAASGQLRGLLDFRDNDLASMAAELGSYAQTVAQAFNAAHNASASVPPPTTLDGRQTGLLDTDSLNFSGATTLGITDSSGKLLHKIDVDFDAGTLSVDGGPLSGIGTTIGSFVSALNAALGANGSASFTDGVLTLSATGSNGLVIADDANNPTSRAGTGFSPFFGLNDLFVSAGHTIPATRLPPTATAGFAPGVRVS